MPLEKIPVEIRDCFEEVEEPCGAPWKREVALTGQENERDRSNKCDWIEGVTSGGNASGIRTLSGATYKPQRAITGEWIPTCKCVSDKPLTPCVVLDPFCGSGTTGVVALRFHRDFVGVELNPEYAEMAERRIGNELPLFANVEQE